MESDYSNIKHIFQFSNKIRKYCRISNVEESDKGQVNSERQDKMKQVDDHVVRKVFQPLRKG
jgi:hypothetical protein